MKNIDVICFDENATPFATFQSHNQKVISNENGIFLTYLLTRNELYTEQKWRLLWSKDNGNSFEVLYESVDATNPAPLETDEDNNVYLVYPDFVDLNSYLMIFKAEQNYKNPTKTVIPNSAAGKVCMKYDKYRKQLYYFSKIGTLHIIDRDGQVKFSTQITNPGNSAQVEYPQLSIDHNRNLHAAWTTNKYNTYHYWSIHYMVSKDGGYKWQRMDGTPIELPVFSDENGNTDRISTDEELSRANTWLSNFIAHNGKLHFMYRAIAHQDYKTTKDDFDNGRQHYIRYDIATGKKDHEIVPYFSGSEIQIIGMDGFFVSDPSNRHSTLYYISKQGGRIACLASDDDGTSWYDYAVSREMVSDTGAIYAIGGFREITKDGYMIGSYTERCGDFADIFGNTRVQFIRLKVNYKRREST
ncbi:hypothetical protein ACFPYJ_15685 [Paenibacillus solisilvae]|uniref:Exo-alpha-sialidase n=1 Tax=Paenibacillus solisilvae TaxID=2486751 RepID=A0ABW0VZ95_9BACL